MSENIKGLKQNNGSHELDQEKLCNESLLDIDKYSVLNNTKKFDFQNLQIEDSKMILVKLIYSLDQGVPFSEQELEILFIRVTKLLSYKQLELKRLTYRCIKQLNLQKYTHIIMQSLINDLRNNNLLIKIEALRFVSIIKEKQFIEILERFVQEAILNRNNYVSTTALLVCINIISAFPNIVKKWKPEIQNQLSFQNIVNYHALILLNEIEKNEKITHIDYIKLLNLPYLQLINSQILKFMQDVTINLEVETQNVMQILQQSLKENQSIIFLESFKCLTQKIEIKNLDFQPIITQFKKLLHTDTDLLSLYRSINTIHYFITNFQGYQMHLQELRPYVRTLTIKQHIGLAPSAIFTYLSFDQNQRVSLLHLFKYRKFRDLQQNFLEGLLELLMREQINGKLVFKVLKKQIFSFSRYSIRTIAMQIIRVLLYEYCVLNYREVLRLLFSLPKSIEKIYQQMVVAFVCSVFFNIEENSISLKHASFCFQYLQKEFEMGSKDFDDISSSRHQEIERNLLELIQEDSNQEIYIQELFKQLSYYKLTSLLNLINTEYNK